MDKQRFEMVCRECGAKDTVPFQPRNPADLLCSSCHRKEREKGPKKGFPMVCCDCGAKGTVPFKPRPGSALRCRDCHTKAGSEPKPKKPFVPKAIPRLEHGTRVHYPIECAECGKSEILDFVPKGGKAPLCTKCRQAEHGRSWRDLAADAKKTDWEITCSACGRPDTVPFRPHKDREYQCRDCHNEEEQPEPRAPRGRRHRID